MDCENECESSICFNVCLKDVDPKQLTLMTGWQSFPGVINAICKTDKGSVSATHTAGRELELFAYDGPALKINRFCFNQNLHDRDR